MLIFPRAQLSGSQKKMVAGFQEKMACKINNGLKLQTMKFMTAKIDFIAVSGSLTRHSRPSE